MTTKLTLMCACVCVVRTLCLGATTEDQLPPDALIIETKPVAPNRELVLWMLKPTKQARETPEDPYTCPEQTRGSYYEGPTRVSLKDTKANRVINTIKVVQEYNEGTDEFDLPYAIRGDYYYHVEGVAKESEGKPVILWLKDYNSDGKAMEFALFDAVVCMGLQTTLLGYSERQDKVIHYPVGLSYADSKGKRSSKTEHWIDYLFSKSTG